MFIVFEIVTLCMQSLLRERCDGQRNILHMCIETSIPTTNKEQKEDEEAQSKMATAPKRSTPVRISPAKATPVKGRFEDCDDDWVLMKIKPVTL